MQESVSVIYLKIRLHEKHIITNGRIFTCEYDCILRRLRPKPHEMNDISKPQRRMTGEDDARRSHLIVKPIYRNPFKSQHPR